jgi:predicted transcriptional regulator
MAVSVTLDPAEQERLAALAESRQRAPHELMREAIRQYLDREEARVSFREEARAAWREYQKTRLHLTGAETARWLDGWGTEAETPPPECHG